MSDDGRVRFLLNAGSRIVANVDDTAPAAIAAPFRDVPRPDLFALAGLRDATPADMDASLTDDQVAALGPAGGHRLSLSARVADVIFNWFD
jgi:hypothetical protein